MLALYLSLLEEDADKALFIQIYEKYDRKLYAVALNILRRAPDAEDAVQDAMLKIILHFETAKKIISKSCLEMEPWCVLIVKHTALSILRRRNRTEEPPERWDPPAPERTEEDALFHALADLIRQMPKGYRGVLDLRLVSEWSFGEIGAALGLTEAAAQKRFSRGRVLLREKLMEGGYEEYDRAGV